MEGVVFEVCGDTLGGEDGALNTVGVIGLGWVMERHTKPNRATE